MRTVADRLEEALAFTFQKRLHSLLREMVLSMQKVELQGMVETVRMVEMVLAVPAQHMGLEAQVAQAALEGVERALL